MLPFGRRKHRVTDNQRFGFRIVGPRKGFLPENSDVFKSGEHGWKGLARPNAPEHQRAIVRHGLRRNPRRLCIIRIDPDRGPGRGTHGDEATEPAIGGDDSERPVNLLPPNGPERLRNLSIGPLDAGWPAFKFRNEYVRKQESGDADRKA